MKLLALSALVLIYSVYKIKTNQRRQWFYWLVLLSTVLLTAYQFRSSYTYVELAPGVDGPPDPGRWNNNKTLLGIDSDNDGVRDDVQRYILAIDNDNEFFKRALLDYAYFIQKGLAEAHITENAEINIALAWKASGCTFYADIKEDVFYIVEVLRKIVDLMLNTRSRRKANTMWRKNIGFMIGGGLNRPEEECLFDIKNYEGIKWKK